MASIWTGQYSIQDRTNIAPLRFLKNDSNMFPQKMDMDMSLGMQATASTYCKNPMNST